MIYDANDHVLYYDDMITTMLRDILWDKMGWNCHIYLWDAINDVSKRNVKLIAFITPMWDDFT